MVLNNCPRFISWMMLKGEEDAGGQEKEGEPPGGRCRQGALAPYPWAVLEVGVLRRVNVVTALG